jgi:type VI secretion system secreted protein Hcp
MLRVEARVEWQLYSLGVLIMAVDAFIWFNEPGAGGVAPKGETRDAAYKEGGTDDDAKTNGAFEIKDFSFSVENPSTIGSATSGAGAGKAKFNEFEITKTTDRASPQFFKNCVAGIHYKKVQLAMRKAGGDPNTAGKEFLRYTFGTVFTTGIDWSGPGDEGPEEKIKFVYGTLQIEYSPQSELGTVETSLKPAKQGWSQILNKEFTE